MRTRALAAIDWFLPPGSSREDRAISRVFVGACLALATIGIAFVAGSPAMEASTLVNVLVEILFIAGPLVMKLTGSRNAAVLVVFAAFTLALGYFAWDQEGLATGLGGWFIVILVTASFLGDTRTALVLGIEIVILCTAIAVGETLGTVPVHPVKGHAKVILTTLVVTTSTAFSAFLTVMYARGRARAAAAVKKAMGDLNKELAERRASEARVAALSKELLDTSRRAGMAEVATGVLHNVGNVLNSVNVSASLVCDRVRLMKVEGPSKSARLLHEATDRSKLTSLGHYLSRLGGSLSDDRQFVLEELTSLVKHIEHIKGIVSRQQAFASTTSGVQEEVRPADVFEDALRLSSDSFRRSDIEVVREYGEVPALLCERHRLLEVLVNLVTNACHALEESARDGKRLTARIGLVAGGDGGRDGKLRFQVVDTGVGIPAESLTSIFGYGFTTKKGGHGFGLHTSALSAQEMGGVLHAASDGPGEGATFTLEVPLRASVSLAA
jgi:signal transduction histidine kinase